MNLAILKKAPINETKTGFRYCEKNEQYIAVAVCKKRCETVKKCYRCYDKWNRIHNQPVLPFLKK